MQIIGICDNAVNHFKEYFPNEVVFSICDHDSRIYYEEEINKSINSDSDTTFIIIGLDGEYGTNIASPMARKCREAGKATIGIVILPFAFEGAVRYEQALHEANELLRNTDAIFFLNNQLILENNKEMLVSEAFKKRDFMLCQIIKSIRFSFNQARCTSG